jgi:hypothetical protein
VGGLFVLCGVALIEDLNLDVVRGQFSGRQVLVGLGRRQEKAGTVLERIPHTLENARHD